MQLNIHIPDDMWERLEEVPKAELVRLIRIGKPQKNTTKGKTVYSQNRQANALLKYINETGGIDRKTANHLALSRKEFREDFEFKHDR